MRKLLLITGISALALTTFCAGFVLAKKVDLLIDMEDLEESEAEFEPPTHNTTKEDVVLEFGSPVEAVQALIPGRPSIKPIFSYRPQTGEVMPEEARKILVDYNYMNPPRDPDGSIYSALVKDRKLDPDLGRNLNEIVRHVDVERTNDKIYIISEAEYFQNNTEYHQATFTWYEIDQVLCDSDDTVVENANRIIDLSNLIFGHMSDNPNVVYIRNEYLEFEYEVCYSPGSYRIDVLGLD
jgi:hypothetical protein